MSGQPNRYPNDAQRFRQDYMNSLGLQSSIDDMNLKANQVYKATGQLPPQSSMPDTRTPTEKLSDKVKMKVALIADFKTIATPQFAQMIIQEIENSPLNGDGSLFIYLAQNSKEIVKELQKKYRYGIVGNRNDAEQMRLFIQKMYNDTKTLAGSIKNSFNRPYSQVKGLNLADIDEYLQQIDIVRVRFLSKYGHSSDRVLFDELIYKLRTVKDYTLTTAEYRQLSDTVLENDLMLMDMSNRIGSNTRLLQLVEDTNNLNDRLPTIQTLYTILEQLDKSIINQNTQQTNEILTRAISLFPDDVTITSLRREMQQTMGFLQRVIDDYEAQAYMDRGGNGPAPMRPPGPGGGPGGGAAPPPPDSDDDDDMSVDSLNVPVRPRMEFGDIEDDDMSVDSLDNQQAGIVAPSIPNNLPPVNVPQQPSQQGGVVWPRRDLAQLNNPPPPIPSQSSSSSTKRDEDLTDDEWYERLINSTGARTTNAVYEAGQAYINGAYASARDIPAGLATLMRKLNDRIFGESKEESKGESKEESEDPRPVRRPPARVQVEDPDIRDLMDDIDDIQRKLNDPLLRAPGRKRLTDQLESKRKELGDLQGDGGGKAGGSGLKRGRGRPKGSGIARPFKDKVDTSRGIEPDRRYVKFGKYLVNTHKLNDNVFAIKTPSGTNISSHPSQRVSPHLSHVFKTIIGGGVPSFNDLSKLNDDEKNYLYNVSKKAEIADKLSIPTPSKDQRDQDIHEYEVARGEIMSGNDNKQFIQKFKLMVVKLVKQGVLPKKEANEVLSDLIELGF